METNYEKTARVMSLKDWIITIIISYIPLVGLIMLFVWAFSSGTNENKKNWAKALLLVQIVGTILVILLYVFVLASAFALYRTGN